MPWGTCVDSEKNECLEIYAYAMGKIEQLQFMFTYTEQNQKYG